MHVHVQSYCQGLDLFAVNVLISSLSGFIVHLWSDLLLACHKSHHICVQKQAVGATVPPTCKDVHFSRPLFPNSECYEANLSLLERARAFHSTLCHIKFLSVQSGEERAQEPRLQSPNHTRGILISPQSSCSRPTGA